MPLDLASFSRQIDPANCVLLLGSGASIPSGAPSAADLAKSIAKQFGFAPDGLSLADASTLAEHDHGNRRKLVELIRRELKNLKPSRGLLNVPLFNWKSIYTTNFDNLIEDSYRERNKPISVYASNFDFSQHAVSGATCYFKLHGTIDRDVVDGNPSRLVLTHDDYANVGQYRQSIFDRLKTDLAGAQLLVIGHSLSDEDVRSVIDHAAKLHAEAFRHREIMVLIFEADDRRARLLEHRDMRCAFGGIDDLFAALARRTDIECKPIGTTGNVLARVPLAASTTKEVSHEIERQTNISSMFNGWPASYADIHAGNTFERTVAKQVANEISSGSAVVQVLLGASGVGKTTAARQATIQLLRQGFLAWEHDSHSPLAVDAWVEVAEELSKLEKTGVLLIDDADAQLNEANRLLDRLVASGQRSLRLVLAASRARWVPRQKSPNIYRHGGERLLRKLEGSEIEALLSLVERNQSVSKLVERSFLGFSRHERRRRLVDRCESDFFVCLRNIFASEKFDDIVLREFAALDENSREIYRLVAALQSAGITVHRQLVVRLLNIPAEAISGVLSGLSDVVIEWTQDARQGIYVWTGRHQVISEIITKYKFADESKVFELFRRIIESTSPTYAIEVRSLRDLCSTQLGVSRIADVQKQNVLYRMMMSVAPGERVPRHKLIRNLIRDGDFEGAASEIRIFEKDFRTDGPVARYKIQLMIARALSEDGKLEEDRLAILQQAVDLAEVSVRRFADNKYVLYAFAEAGLAWFRVTADTAVFDSAMRALVDAEERLGDPEIGVMASRFGQRLSFGNHQAASGIRLEDDETVSE